MPCINAPSVGLPSLGISLPTIALPPVQLPGLNLCCTFQLPPIPTALINQALVLVTSLLPALGKLLGPLLAGLNIAIQIINGLLDLIQFSCPLNG